MSAYYNEIDQQAAQWLRNLIAAGHIADGEVDERSITDVRADDLVGFTQCHMFAGVGVWSYALRQAGWDDSRPVWTGSCPCQPFSVAGAGKGTEDERHLWPVWFDLIKKCRPTVIFGEQVEAAIRHGWLDLVQADLEGSNYAFAAFGIPAAGVGAPHIRARLFFVADSEIERRGEAGSTGRRPAQWFANGGANIRLDNPNNTRLEGFGGRHQATGGWFGEVRPVAEAGESSRMEHPRCEGFKKQRWKWNEPKGFASTSMDNREPRPAGPTNGFWRDADWLFCRDGKWRPVEPGTSALAPRTPGRVVKLRAYGNAICAPVAREFIKAYMECRP